MSARRERALRAIVPAGELTRVLVWPRQSERAEGHLDGLRPCAVDAIIERSAGTLLAERAETSRRQAQQVACCSPRSSPYTSWIRSMASRRSSSDPTYVGGSPAQARTGRR